MIKKKLYKEELDEYLNKGDDNDEKNTKNI